VKTPENKKEGSDDPETEDEGCNPMEYPSD
jgi:hypothetical protein